MGTMERVDGPAYRWLGYSSLDELLGDLAHVERVETILCNREDVAALRASLPGLRVIVDATPGGPLPKTVWVAQ